MDWKPFLNRQFFIRDANRDWERDDDHPLTIVEQQLLYRVLETRREKINQKLYTDDLINTRTWVRGELDKKSREIEL